MNIIHLTDDIRLEHPCVATIGFFDGVHRGHRYLISMMKEVAERQGLETTVITFDRHPRTVLRCDYNPDLLSTNQEKMILLAQTGIDNCVVIPFSEDIASLSAREFMLKVLRERLNVTHLIIGYDNRFGNGRTDGFDDYVRYGKEMGMQVVCGTPFTIDGVKVSSSVVRSFLLEGEVEMAERCLGYPYTMMGTVVEGEHLGTRIGFPTANIIPSDPRKLIPAAGVYGVKVRIDGTMQQLRGMMNIGSRPTFEGKKQTIETHIFRFTGDLYGQTLVISFDHHLRSEKKFNGIKELAAQLKEDMDAIEERFDKSIEE